jgi:hypothetical protein
MPLARHRGQLLRALAAWRAQDFSSERLDFVFVSNQREPRIDQLLAKHLAADDALRGGAVYIKTDNVMAQFQYGARYARGAWMLFTEPHAIPQPQCLRELIEHLVEHELVAGRVASSRSGANGDKFTTRGFALRRNVYRSIGGIEAHYGWLSGSLLAARLAVEGHRIARVPTAIVECDRAIYAQQEFDYIWEHHRELARYLEEGSDTLRPYLMQASLHVPFPQQARSAQTCEARTTLMLRYWLARFRHALLSFTSEQAQRNCAMAADRLSDWAEATFRVATPAVVQEMPAPPLERRRAA